MRAPRYRDFDRVVTRTDRSLNLMAVFAVHDTRLGPAMGGVRRWHYRDEAAAIQDAMRLAQGMTYKNAVAGLPFGGGKAVIAKDSNEPPTPAQLRRFGEWVEELGGAYITAEDVGMNVADLKEVAAATRFVTGTGLNGRGGDPAPMTAKGVFDGIRAACGGSVAGVSVAVQGLGNVGKHLCAALAEAGASLVVADVDATKVANAVEVYGAQAAPTDAVLGARVDVVSPCALGRALTSETVRELRAGLVAGSANNQLASPGVGRRLHERGIRYAPDYVINAGGIISAAYEYLDCEGAEHQVAGIGPRLVELFEQSAAEDCPPAEIAERWVRERLCGAGRQSRETVALHEAVR